MCTTPPNPRRNCRGTFRQRHDNRHTADRLAEALNIHDAIDALCQELLVIHDDLVLQLLPEEACHCQELLVIHDDLVLQLLAEEACHPKVANALSLQKGTINDIADAVATAMHCLAAPVAELGSRSAGPKQLPTDDRPNLDRALAHKLVEAYQACELITHLTQELFDLHEDLESLCTHELQLYYEDTPLSVQKDAIEKIKDLAATSEDHLDAVIAYSASDSAESSVDDEWFPWPATDAPASRFGFHGDFFFYQDGVLSFLGYHVGRSGGSAIERRQILDGIFHNELPRVNSPEYMEEWGQARKAGRLKKLANVLASLARNEARKMKRGHGNYSEAIRDREEDLDYLYKKYYVGRFNFDWPRADVS